MSLGEKLILLRKKAGFSQEEVADKLDVSRQTVSKWETDTTTPELKNVKLLSQLYNISYDSLVNANPINGDLTSVELIVDEIDWTKAWSKKYPILASYQDMFGVDKYREIFTKTYETFKIDFPNISETDVFLILKDILYQKYKDVTSKKKK